MKTLNFISLSLLILSIFCGCSKSETETIAAKGATYYPVNLGRMMIYKVDSVIITPQGGGTLFFDSTHSIVKEVYADTLHDTQSNLTYRIDRYVSRNLVAPYNFILAGSVFATVNATNFLRTEGNFRYIKLLNYFQAQTQWDSNSLNDPDAVIDVATNKVFPFSKQYPSLVTNIADTFSAGTNNFTDVVTVEAKSDPQILTEKRYQLEKYAPNVGLVYREVNILDTQNLDATIAWEKKASRGFFLKQTLLSYK